jgi:hypothetical protein
MNATGLVPLIAMTLRTPQVAAEQIIALRLSRDVLWTALALVALVNTAIVVLLISLSPPEFALPGYFSSPLALFFLLTGLLVIYVHALYWAGRAVGGKGDLGDLLALMVWLQALRAGAQMLVLVAALAIPPLAALLSLVIAIWGFWILLNFITAAMRLPTVFHAVATLIVSGIGVVLGVGLVLFFIGVVAQGVPNV